MYEITYCSIAMPDLKQDAIEAILDKARAFNAEKGITGCLLYHAHQFIQMLEGERDEVSSLLSRIRNDARHRHVLLLSEGEKSGRSFSNWTMAFRELRDSELADMEDDLFIDNFLAFSELASKPTRTVRIFWDRVQRLLTNDYTR